MSSRAKVWIIGYMFLFQAPGTYQENSRQQESDNVTRTNKNQTVIFDNELLDLAPPPPCKTSETRARKKVGKCNSLAFPKCKRKTNKTWYLEEQKSSLVKIDWNRV